MRFLNFRGLRLRRSRHLRSRERTGNLVRALMVGAPFLIAAVSATDSVLRTANIGGRFADLLKVRSEILIVTCFVLMGSIMLYSYRELERLVAHAQKRHQQKPLPGTQNFDEASTLISQASKLARNSCRILILNVTDLDDYHEELSTFFRNFYPILRAKNTSTEDFRMIMNVDNAEKFDLALRFIRTFKNNPATSCACVGKDPRAFSHLSFCLMVCGGEYHVFMFSEMKLGSPLNAVLIKNNDVGEFLSGHFERMWKKITTKRAPLLKRGLVNLDQVKNLRQSAFNLGQPSL